MSETVHMATESDLQKTRTINDAELLVGGAEYAENGRLVATDDQVEGAYYKMERDITEQERQAELTEMGDQVDNLLGSNPELRADWQKEVSEASTEHMYGLGTYVNTVKVAEALDELMANNPNVEVNFALLKQAEEHANIQTSAGGLSVIAQKLMKYWKHGDKLYESYLASETKQL